MKRDRERDWNALLQARKFAAGTTMPPTSGAIMSTTPQAATAKLNDTPASSSPEHFDTASSALINDIISRELVQIEFHPIIDVISRQVVGFEALSRGPEGPLRSPVALFAAARAADRAGELDWVCRATAFRLFLAADLHPTVSLLVNVERDSLVTVCPPQLVPTIHEAERRLRVFIDIEGRAVARYPREVLETVRRARAAHWGVSMNDLEISSSTVALLPVLEPDVVRLNRQAQATGLDRGRSALFAALAETEHTGAALLTDRIETAQDESDAITSGTRYTQGFFYGTPTQLPAELPVPKRPLRILRNPVELGSPFEITAAGGSTAAAPISRCGVDKLIGDFVGLVDAASTPLFVGTLTADLSELGNPAYAFVRAIADKSALHLIIGRHTALFDDWCTEAVELPQAHPFLNEICLVAISPHLASIVALRARDIEAHGTPIFDVAFSQNPATSRRVVRCLLTEAETVDRGVPANSNTIKSAHSR